MDEDAGQIKQMGARTAGHDKLNPFAGKFRADVTLWMGPGDPMRSTGTMQSKWVRDGRFLKQTYTGDPVEGPFDAFAGTGYWGYSEITDEYQGFWIDNASTWMQLDTGKVDASGKVWTMHSQFPNPRDGSLISKRTVIRLRDQDHHEAEAFFTSAGGEEARVMLLKYARAPDSPSAMRASR